MEKEVGMKKRVVVWLIGTDGILQGKIMLQRRSDSGLYQATWNGELKEKESPFEAIQRKVKEELGEEFLKNYPFSSLIPIRTIKTKSENGQEMISCHWMGPLKEENIRLIKLHVSASLLFSLGKEQEIYPLSSGKDLKKNIVLFDDDFKILKEEVFPQIELTFR